MILIAYSSFVLLGLSSAVMGPIWSGGLQTDFRQPVDALGWILLTGTLGYLLGSANSARFYQHFPTASVLALSLFICAAGMIGYTLASQWSVMVACGLVLGFGTGVLDGSSNIYFAAYFNERLINWLHAAFGLGALLAPQLINGLVVGRDEGWRSLFLLLTIAFALVGGLFVLTRHWWQPLQTHEEKHQTSAVSTFRLPIVWIGIVLFVMYSGMEATAGNWGVGLFESREMALVTANNWITAYWLSFTVGRIFFGIIITRLNPVTTIRLCLLLVLVGAAMLAASVSPALSGAGIVVFGFALSPIFALLISQTQARLGPLHAPTAIGAQVAAASVGAGVLSAAAGVAVRFTGYEIIPLVLILATLVMIVAYQISERLTTRKRQEVLAASD